MSKYQGREFRTHLQAPNPAALERLIAGTRGFAREHDMHDVEVLQKRRDPDGGYEATVIAHNFNPFKWVKEKWGEGEEIRRGAEYARDPEGTEFEWSLEAEEERLKAQREKAQEAEEREERTAAVREKYQTSQEKREVEEAEQKAEELRKQKEETDILVERASKAKYESDIAKKEKDVTAARKEEWARKYGKYKDVKGEVTKTAGQISKAFAPAGAPGGVKRFYLGGAKESLYVPQAPSAERLREIPAKRALEPHIERLRRATAPGAGVTMPIARAVMPSERLAQQPQAALLRQPLQYGFLREAGRLKSQGPLGQVVSGQLSGTSKLEQAVFAEIKANNDVDTLEHIKAELTKLGYQRGDVEQAVRSLEQKGFVEKQKLLPGGQAEYVVR